MKKRLVVEVDCDEECGGCDFLRIHGGFLECELFDAFRPHTGPDSLSRIEQCLKAEELYKWMQGELLSRAAHLGEWGCDHLSKRAWEIRDKLDAPIA